MSFELFVPQSHRQRHIHMAVHVANDAVDCCNGIKTKLAVAVSTVRN